MTGVLHSVLLSKAMYHIYTVSDTFLFRFQNIVTSANNFRCMREQDMPVNTISIAKSFRLHI